MRTPPDNRGVLALSATPLISARLAKVLPMRRNVFLFAVALVAGAVLTGSPAVPQEAPKGAAQNKAVTSPKEHFGFDMGEDYCLANYKQFESYFKKIEGQTDRL